MEPYESECFKRHILWNYTRDSLPIIDTQRVGLYQICYKLWDLKFLNSFSFFSQSWIIKCVISWILKMGGCRAKGTIIWASGESTLQGLLVVCVWSIFGPWGKLLNVYGVPLTAKCSMSVLRSFGTFPIFPILTTLHLEKSPQFVCQIPELSHPPKSQLTLLHCICSYGQLSTGCIDFINLCILVFTW